jgi:hypothetical protein
MQTHDPGFLTRFWLAFLVFFRVMFDASFAGNALRLRAGQPVPALPPESEPADLAAPARLSPPPAAVPAPPEPAPAVAQPESAKLHLAQTDAALQLLGLLQREARLLDFVQEDMAGYTDAEIGAAARVVHDQCKRTLDAHLKLERIRHEEEGSTVSVPKGFLPSEIRLVGNVAGEPPFKGALNHAGWRVASIELPKLTDGHDVHVLAPAEVEL